MDKSSALNLMHGVPPAQVAVWSTYATAAPLGQPSQRLIRVLCWPEVPDAWPRLTGAIHSVATRPVRTDPEGAPSWMREAAPQICDALPVDAPVAEAMLAALVQRLPVRLSVSMDEVGHGMPSSRPTRCRSLFRECLQAYAEHLEQTNQTSRAFAVGSPTDAATQRVQLAAFNAIRPLVEQGERVDAMELRHWAGPTVPLPVELAQVIAEAAGRTLDDPERPSPLWDAARSKLVGRPRWVAADSRRRRRG